MDEFERKELKRKQEHSKRKIDSLIKFLESHNVPTTMKFEEALESFKNNPLFNSAEKLDQLKAFSTYINHKIDEEDELEYKTKIRKERKNREKFRELMEELISSHKFTYKSHWKDIAALIKDDPRYRNLLLQSGSKPVDIFTDYLKQLKERFQDFKIKFKTLLKTKSVRLGADITKEDFTKNLSAHEEYISLPEDIKDLLYDYYIYKVSTQITILGGA
jgi:pre-mRNA-processing factor 40